MDIKQLALVGTMLLAATPALATLAGHNVILVHGFQAADLISSPTSDAQIEQNGYNAWSQYWNQRAEARFDWPATERVEGGIAVRMYNKAVALSESGFCQNGCVMVTHSTGDLVVRYFLEHQEDWLSSAGYQPLNILAVLDFAGAGGGTELANAAVSVANNTSWYSDPLRIAVEAWIGDKLNAAWLGVVNDLQPTVARNLATTPNSVPRLRFTGAGCAYLGVTAPFISGKDDGVVPPHSSCGSSKAGAYDSCSSSVAFNGKQTKVLAPDSFYYNHYPVLMGEEINHSETIGDSQVDGSLTFVNNDFLAGLKVEFSTYTKVVKAWWKPWSSGDTYQYVSDSDTRTMSEAVYTSLNQ